MGRDRRSKRKERVIHTRVSEELEEEIKQAAEELGMSVSHLIRNLLADATKFAVRVERDAEGVVNRIWRDAAPKEEASEDEAPQTVSAEPLGFQELTLNLNAVCDDCNAILPKGARATVAVYDLQGPRRFRCLECVAKLSGNS